MRRMTVALAEIKGKLKYDLRNTNKIKRDRRIQKIEGMSNGQLGRYRSLMEAGKSKNDDYWDVVPTEFRSETALMQAKGAGFNSMFEDSNPRSVAIAEEVSASRFKPPLTSNLPHTASKSMQDLYKNVPELQMLEPFKLKQPKQNVFRAPTSSTLHPHIGSLSKLPFPISEKLRNPYPTGNYNPSKDPAYDNRVQ